jgi:hypothetical protein
MIRARGKCTCDFQRKGDFATRKHCISCGHIWNKPTHAYVKHTQTIPFMQRRQYQTRVYVVFTHVNANILTDTSVYIDINVRYPALSVWQSHAYICLYDGHMFFLWWKRSPQVFFDAPTTFMTIKLNFPLFCGGPKVTFSYAVPFPTHTQCYTLSSCVP